MKSQNSDCICGSDPLNPCQKCTMLWKLFKVRLAKPKKRAAEKRKEDSAEFPLPLCKDYLDHLQ